MSKPRVKSLTTPSGIEIWHVEDYTVPVVSLDFAFMGGAAQDPAALNGLCTLLADLLDEGAGPFSSAQFQEKLEEKAIELSFDGSRDRLHGSLRTLSEEAQAAFDLLALALQAPRFDGDAIDRVRAQTIASLKSHENDPSSRAHERLNALAFEGHAYALPVDGRSETLGAITQAALRTQHAALITRAQLYVVAVGAISEADLIAGVEKAFGPLPAKGGALVLAPVPMHHGGRLEVIDLDLPQSTLLLALPGLARKDADFSAAIVANHILGGGSFTSRLWNEIREKRGLAYSVWSSLYPMQQSALFMAGTATSNERVGESLAILREEIVRMAQTGPSAQEVERAKSYLTGSYALRFDSSRKIAAQLLEIAIEGLGIDYIDRRNSEIEAVTLAQTQAVSARLFAQFNPLVVVAGRPQGLTA